MKRNYSWYAISLLLVLISCAVITVNIYFPEKDVQEAYKALEKELMTPDAGSKETQPPGGAPPQGSIGFEIVATAHAQEAGMADRIAETIKKMPDVVEAYRQMGERLAQVDGLRNSGAAGEGSSGLLVAREKNLSAGDMSVIEADNANRKTIMEGMTRAIVRINRLPQDEANLAQVRPQAVEQFAAIRRDLALPGWWIQLPDGNWTRK